MNLLSIILQAPASTGGGYGQILLLLLTVLFIIVIVASIKTINDDKIGEVVTDQFNKVVKVNLIGGLLGLFLKNALKSLNQKIKIENAQGWEVIQIIPDTNYNLIIIISRLLLLVITLFVFTTSNGYYIILRRKS